MPNAAQRRPAPRRGPGTVLRGLVAIVAIAVLLVGIPYALIAIAGSPLPDAMPSLGDITGALTEQDDGSLFVGALVWIAWIGWASFALSILVEIPAAIRGVKAPRIPALRFQQRTASGLVAAAALLFTVGPIGVATAAEAPAHSPAGSTVAAVATAETPASPAADSATETAAQTAPTPSAAETAPAAAPAETPAVAPEAATPEAPEPRSHVVAHGESLWKIAETELGDGARWTEIAELNYGVEQPGGNALDETHWIDPGWTLQLPADPAAATEAAATEAASPTHVVEQGDTLWGIAEEQLGDGSRYPEIVEATEGTVQPDGRQLTDPDLIIPGWTVTVSEAAPELPVAEPPPEEPPVDEQPPVEEEPPTEEEPPVAEEPPVDEQPPPEEEQPPAEEEQPPAEEQPEAEAQPDAEASDENAESAFPVRTAAGIGALMAAGLLAYVAAKRRSQQRRRKPGQRIAMPTGAAAVAEQELRSVADPMSVETVDLALRSLAAHSTATGMALPPLRLARLTSEQFELYLTEAAELPTPFVATAEPSVWTLPSEARTTLDADDYADVPAPYPSLVTIGHGPEDGHLLLDLERVGSLALIGSDERSHGVLTALAVEFATSPWADDLQVTLVGICPELADGLDTGRVRHLPSAGSLLDELAIRAENDRAALDAAGVDSLAEARARGVAPAAWTPEIVLLAQPLDDDEHAQLTELIDSLPRVAVAAVTSADDAVGDWAVDMSGSAPDAAILEPLGVELDPQHLDPVQYQQILELLGISNEDNYTEVWSNDEPEPDLVDLPVRGTRAEQSEQEDSVGAEADSSAESRTEMPAFAAFAELDDDPDADGSQPVPADADNPAFVEATAAVPPEDAPSFADDAPSFVETEPSFVDDAPSFVEDEPSFDGAEAPSASAPSEATDDTPSEFGAVAAAPDDDDDVDTSHVPDTIPADFSIGGFAAFGDLGSAGSAVLSPDYPSDPMSRPGSRNEGVGSDDAGRGQSPEEWDAPADLPTTAERDAGGSPVTPSPGRPEPAVPASAHPMSAATPADIEVGPSVLLLGPVEIDGAEGPVEQSKIRQLTEIAAYIALHPGLDHTALDDAIWPGNPVTQNTRNTAVSKLRRWFGRDDTGQDYLPRVESGYRFHDAVDTDWQRWTAAVGNDPREVPTEVLVANLELVRGQPFAGVNPRRYAWAEHLKQEMIASIVDAAHELARRGLHAGDAHLARRASTIGLQVEPGMEMLWRDRLRAEHIAGNRAAIEDAVARLTAITDDLGGDMEDATIELLQELLPSPSRQSASALPSMY